MFDFLREEALSRVVDAIYDVILLMRYRRTLNSSSSNDLTSRIINTIQQEEETSIDRLTEEQFRHYTHLLTDLLEKRTQYDYHYGADRGVGLLEELSSFPEVVSRSSPPQTTSVSVRRPQRIKLGELRSGWIVNGVVKHIAQFGAFVDIGAEQDGLVHISELSETRVHRVGDVVKVGQEVEVTILDVDINRRRISLSMKRQYHDEHESDDEAGDQILTPMQQAFLRAQSRRTEQGAARKREDRRETHRESRRDWS